MVLSFVIDSPFAFFSLFSCFNSRDFAEPPQVSFGLAVLSREERLYQVPRHRRADSPAAHAKDIHMIIFHTLPGRKVVMNQGGADA